MKKHIMDEKTGISYTLYGDYYLPDIDALFDMDGHKLKRVCSP